MDLISWTQKVGARRELVFGLILGIPQIRALVGFDSLHSSHVRRQTLCHILQSLYTARYMIALCLAVSCVRT